ncbi:MAG: FAD-dependent oxidoreductase [Snowella sp.]|nr:FAD-dependent oxidoreductase [Snowella sp.]
MVRIAIIGAGVVGAAIAYELSLISGLDIILLDEKEPATGSTGAALGVLMGVVSKRGWTLRQTSLERYETLIPELEGCTGKQIPYNRQGLILLIPSEPEKQQWEKHQALRHKQGYPLEIWNQSQLSQTCPQLSPDAAIGAVYSPRDHQVNPTTLTQCLITAAQLNGVKCHFGTSINLTDSLTSFQDSVKHLDRIPTHQGNFAIDYLIVTAGLGTTALTQSLSQTVTIQPVLGQAIQVKLPQPMGNADFQPVISGDDVHIVPLGFGEYWVGATVEFPSDNHELIGDRELLEMVYQKAISFCPDLAQGEIVKTWSGKRPRPMNEPAPIIRELTGYNNVWLATGHYRNGVLLAPATALAIKDKILALINRLN